MKNIKMTNKIFKCLLLAVTITLLISQSFQRTGTVGTFDVVLTPEAKKACSDNNISDGDIVPSKDKTKKLMDKVKKKFPTLSAAIETVMEGESADYGAIGKDAFKEAMFPMMLSVVGIVISIFCCPILVCWSIFAMCCCKKKACCVGKSKKGKKTFMQKCCPMATFICGGILGLFIFMVFINVIGLGKSVRILDCWLRDTQSVISHGYKGDDFIFIGTEGMNDMTGKISTDINNVVGATGNDLSGAVALGINNRGTELTTIVSDLKTHYGNIQLDVLGGGGAKWQPASSKLLATNDPYLEANFLGEIAETVHEGMVTAEDLINGSGATLQNTLNGVFSNLSDIFDDLNSQINDQVSKLSDKLSEEKIGGPIRMGSWGIVLFCGGLSALILTSLICVACCNKCHCLLCINRPLIGIFNLFSIVANLLGVVVIVAGSALLSVCIVVDKALNDETFMGDLAPASLMEYLTPCLYGTGDSGLDKLLPSGDSGNFDKLTNLIQGFSFLDAGADAPDGVAENFKTMIDNS